MKKLVPDQNFWRTKISVTAHVDRSRVSSIPKIHENFYAYSKELRTCVVCSVPQIIQQCEKPWVIRPYFHRYDYRTLIFYAPYHTRIFNP